MNTLPFRFVTNICEIYGDAGQQWLDGLPSLLEAVERNWQINLREPFENLSYNYVAPAEMQDGTKAILKIGMPGSGLGREARCLDRFEGKGCVRLLKYDTTRVAMLVERVVPGHNIKQLDDPRAVRAFTHVIDKLHRPIEDPAEFPGVHDLGKSFNQLRSKFNGGAGPLPVQLVDKAEDVYLTLANSMSGPVLLHGDLHHANILAGSRDPWISIDPKGVVGEPEFEFGSFLRNPLSALVKNGHLQQRTARRLDIITDIANFDRKRIAGWGFALAVLSAIWIIEDHQTGWSNVLEVARAIQTVCPV